VPARRHVYHYVEDLGAAGLPDESVAALHALRTKANGGKHDTESEASHAEARHLLDDARVAVEQIGVVGSAPGADMESDTVGRRRFGLMVADYPTGGEVDYEVCLLRDDGGIVPVDHFQLRYNDENEVVAELQRHGHLDQAPVDPAAQLVTAHMKGSNEFSGIWVYEGSLRSIVEAFAPHQHSEALPFLRRDRSEAAIRSATAMTAVDLGADAADADALLHVLEADYAMDTRVVEPTAVAVSTLVAAASVEELTGPRFVGPNRFAALIAQAVAVETDTEMLVRADGTLVVKLGVGALPMP